MAFGRITAADGIAVNGVAYDASGARIFIDGRAADASELQMGHVVTVTGTLDANGTTGTATEVALVTDVRGEITGIDADASAVFVLGQTVRVTDETLLGPRIGPAGIAGLQPGMIVEVSGFADADGDFIASRMDTGAGTAAAQVRGAVNALDAQARSLRINDLDVEYSNAIIQGTIAEGAIVTVQGAQGSTGGGPLIASRVEAYAGLGAPSEKGDLEGIITAFASSADFDVNGQPIVADANTKYVLHGMTLDANVAVWVKGRFDASGVLVADKIQTKPAHGVARKVGKKK